MITLADPNCPRCHGIGHVYEDADAIVPIRGRTCECILRNAATVSVERRLRDARIPSKYAEAAFEHFNVRSTREISVDDPDRETPVRVAQADIDVANLARVRELAADPLENETIVFTGPFGVGKTYLAACLLLAQICEHGKSGLFVVSPEYVRTFMPGGAEPEEQRALRARARDVDVLLLDELGVEKASPFAMRELYDLINYRTNNPRSTIVTSNKAISDALMASKEDTGLTAEAREAVEIGKRIFSRLAENRIAPVTWPVGTDDHRLARTRTSTRKAAVAARRDLYEAE